MDPKLSPKTSSKKSKATKQKAKSKPTTKTPEELVLDTLMEFDELEIVYNAFVYLFPAQEASLRKALQVKPPKQDLIWHAAVPVIIGEKSYFSGGLYFRQPKALKDVECKLPKGATIEPYTDQRQELKSFIRSRGAKDVNGRRKFEYGKLPAERTNDAKFNSLLQMLHAGKPLHVLAEESQYAPLVVDKGIESLRAYQQLTLQFRTPVKPWIHVFQGNWYAGMGTVVHGFGKRTHLARIAWLENGYDPAYHETVAIILQPGATFRDFHLMAMGMYTLPNGKPFCPQRLVFFTEHPLIGMVEPKPNHEKFLNMITSLWIHREITEALPGIPGGSYEVRKIKGDWEMTPLNPILGPSAHLPQDSRWVDGGEFQVTQLSDHPESMFEQEFFA